MPQSSNLLSFVPVPNPELGPRLSSTDSSRPRPVAVEGEEEAILRKIAEAALSATGADGAALALRRNGAVLCLARAGEMAPPLGARLDDRSGISGECLRHGEALRCDDTENDDRVDADACRSLGLRSLAIAAVRDGAEIIGILEVFSPQPSTFTESHLEVLRQLAELVSEETSSSAATATTSSAISSEAAYVAPIPAQPSPKESSAAANQISAMLATPLPADVNVAAYMAAHDKGLKIPPHVAKIVLIGLAVILVAAPVGWYLGHRTPYRTSASAPPPAATLPTQTVAPASEPLASSDPSVKPSHNGSAVLGSNSKNPKAVRDSLTNAASLDRIASSTHRSTAPIRVVHNEPTTDAESDVAPGLNFGNGESKSNTNVASILNAPVPLPTKAPPISQGVEGGELETKVAALYPPQARAIGQHGTVVLEALVGEDGSVRDVKVVSGPPLLRQAAIDAVRRWRYRPFKLNGKPISAQTQVKLDFRP